MARKTYVLDTNILIRYPNALSLFEDNDLVITATTLDELDRHKTDSGERGMLVRHAIHELGRLNEKAHAAGTTLAAGVAVNEQGGTLRIETDHVNAANLPAGWDVSIADNRILSCVKEMGAVLVTEDVSMRVKAESIGIRAQAYRNAEIISNGYTGRTKLTLPETQFVLLAKAHGLAILPETKDDDGDPLVANEYVTVHNAASPVSTVLARFVEGEGQEQTKLTVIPESFPIGHIKPRNAGQRFALDALFDEEIPLVILRGPAGTAKTFLSITAGMSGLGDRWSQIIATRNNIEMDRSIGALPGEEDEKVMPLLRGVQDALKTYYVLNGTDEKDVLMNVDDTFDRGDIVVQSLGFMRGRSITNTFIIIDEAQNTTPHQIESIITRAGKGCKVVLCGDESQIDDPKLDSRNNGLVFAAEVMKGSRLCAQIAFAEKECERSPLAKEAAERMGRAMR